MPDWETTRFEVAPAGAGAWARQHGPIALVDLTRGHAIAVLGEPLEESEDVLPGLGVVAVWAVRWPCGCEVVLTCRTEDALSGLEVITNDADVEHALHHLEGGIGAVRWRCDARDQPEFRPERCAVVRQDDNGQRFLVDTLDSQFSAECVRRRFEAAGHKQLYWVEQVR